MDEAVRWMERQQGELYLMDRYRCSMVYSKSGSNSNGAKNESRLALLPDPPRADWTCAKCGILNFARRDKCFKCASRRSEAEGAPNPNKPDQASDGSDQIGTNPCNTLIFRGLDALTTEDNVKAALAAMTAIVPKNVHILRDVYTGTSLGYCFVEFGSVQDSCQLMEYLPGRNFEVDGKLIFVNYAKNTYSTIMASLAHWTQQGWDYDRNKADPYYYQQQQTSGTTATTSSIAQAAIQQAQALSQAGNAAAVAASATPTQAPSDPWSPTVQKQYPDPDVTGYQYDASSSYYYDPVTGLYYDANTQYYYSSQTQQFLYWDGEKKTYVPAPSSQASASTETKKDEKDKEKDKDKKEKVKHAKKIAKEMENWAKKLNAQKQAILEAKKPQLAAAQPIIAVGTESGANAAEKSTADAAYALLVEKTGSDKLRMSLPPSFAPAKAGAASPEDNQKQSLLVASYGGDSDSDDREDDDAANGARGNALDEAKLIDYSKLACLLCKRQFPSKDVLDKHTKLSDLHKQNLAKLAEQSGGGSQNGLQYRDRAKERRQKYGLGDDHTREPWKTGGVDSVAVSQTSTSPAPLISDQQYVSAPSGDDNVGSKLMQKMGWNAGQGLGRANQGIVKPIEAEYNGTMTNTAGLGSRTRNIGLQPGDTYCDAVRKTFYARYNDMNNHA